MYLLLGLEPVLFRERGHRLTVYTLFEGTSDAPRLAANCLHGSLSHRAQNPALANILKMEGTEYLFCYPSNTLIEAAVIAGIKPIMSRTERTTVNMADGYSRVTNGRLTGVVVTQPGPGIENAFAGNCVPERD